jgi:hypothetical protein
VYFKLPLPKFLLPQRIEKNEIPQSRLLKLFLNSISTFYNH